MRHPAILPAFVAALALGAAPAGAVRAADALTVFGDSYSAPRHAGVANWPSLLRERGEVGRVRDFARSGAVAADIGPNTFRRQIRLWSRRGRPLGDDTVVYLGNNDIDGDLRKARAGYRRGVAALVRAGAASGGRRLLLVQPHDLGGTPLYGGSADERAFMRGRTRQWNRFVADLARRRHATVVDLASPFDRVTAHPRRYGFRNVTAPDPRRSRTTALYDDDFHFGARGQRIIADTIGDYLRSGSRFAEELASDAPDAAEDGRQRQGLAFFPVGDGPAAAAGPSTADADPARADFDEAYGRGGDRRGDVRRGGVGLTYGLGGTTLGFAVTGGDGGPPASAAGLAGTAADSDGVSAFVRQRLGAFQLDTRFAYGRDRDVSTAFDGPGSGRGAFDGQALDLAQRVGVPVSGDGYTLTPWAELGYRGRRIDGLDLGAGQRSAEAEVGETLASLGLDGHAAPIRLGEATWLTLTGGLSYAQGLGRGDQRVRVAAAGGGEGLTVDRPPTRMVGLSLGGSLALGEALALDAGLALERDAAASTDASGHVNLAWRF